MEDRCALSAGMVALDGKLYPEQEVAVLLQSSPAKMFRRCSSSRDKK
jgi:hypothetical protein